MLSRNHGGTLPAGARVYRILQGTFVLLSLCALSFIPIHMPAPSVVTELRCNEGTGTITTDASGNNHNATLTNGPTWVAGKDGQGINLDGTNDYLNITDHADYTLTPSVSYTWSAWVKNNNFNQWSTVWSQTLNATNFFYFYAHTSSDAEAGPVTNGITVYWYSGSSKLVIHSNNNVLSAATWSYITVTYDASQSQANRFTIYVNGTDVTNRSDVISTGTIAAIDPTNIRVGSNQPYGEYLNGAVDEIRYYRRLLSVAEIQSDMNTTNGPLPDVTAPTVNITTPAAGNVSATINITANASDNVGVAGVQFLLDGNNLGAEDASSPYSVSWNTTTATNGNHTLTAKARDAAGNVTTSSAIIVNVNNNDITAPTVNITAPAAGNVSGTINVTANASDNVGVAGVQFLLDGNNIGAEDASAPYSVSWNTTTVGNGNHTLTATARDAAGNTTTSAGIIVNVSNDGTAPTVNITAPAAGGVSGTINVTANASDNVGVAGVQFLLDGNNLGSEDVSSPYSVSWNTTTTANGNHNLTAKARDAAGNTTTSVVVVVNVSNDLTAPTVSVDPPASSPVSGTINVTATAADNIGVAGVQFLLDGNNLGAEDVTAPFSVSWTTATSSNGNHNITARAIDAAGNITTSAAVVFNVFNNGLVAAFGFNENTGTIANDNSGNGNNGVLTNGPGWSAAGKYGAAISFDGTNDFVNINDANSLDLTNGMTVEAWVSASNLTGYKTAICKENGTSNLAYALAANNNNSSGSGNQRPDSRIRIGTTTRTVTGSAKLPMNTWTHIAITYDGSMMRLYVNGVQSSTFATTGNITATTNPLRIGGTTALGQYFAGLIDEVRIYNRALSLPEIQTDMTTPIAPDLTNPTISIIAPPPGDVSGTVTISANASDNISVTGVQFILDGNNLGAEDITAPYSVSWNTTTVQHGTHVLTAKARDAAGNTATSADLIVNVNNDFISPTITITSPGAGTVAGTIDITADANDNTGVAGVQFLLNGNNLGAEDITPPYSFTWNTNTVTDGNYTLTAKARDAAGNVTTSPAVIVNVLNHPPDTEFPTVNITLPPAGEVVGTVNVTADANDNVGIVGVQFLLNGNNLGAEDLTPPYSVSWNTLATANGTYTLTAKARDAAGNITTSANVVTTVNNPPDTGAPIVNITAPAAGNVSGTINVTATASDNIAVTGVRFLLDGNPISEQVPVAPYAVSWNTLTASNGQHTLTATAHDAAGNMGTSTNVIVTVNNDVTGPAVNITSPSAGSVSGTITINANASDNVGVVGVQFLLDGNNLGAEDPASPYSVSWTTNTVANGSHVLTAKARDAAGNITTSSSVNVTVNNVTNLLTAINFNEGTGTTAADLSGKNHNGTLTGGATWTTGKFGQAVNLNGSGNYVNIADHADYTLNPAQNYTWSAWVKNNNFNEWSTVWSQALNTTNFFYFYAHTTSQTDGGGGPVTNGISVYWTTGNNKVALHSNNNVLTAGQWSYVAVTYDAGQSQANRFTIYVNGVDVTNRSAVGSSGTIATIDPTGIRVGSNSAFGEYLNGAVDELRYYNRLLTAAEIQNDMNTPIGVDNTAPAVNISAPLSNSFAQGTINVTANASDNLSVAGVQFLLDGNNLGPEDVTAPYSVSWNTTTATNGNHVLTARARDAAGNATTSTGVAVVVDNSVPLVNITAPAGTINGTVNVNANASDNNGVMGVQFLLDGNNFGTEDLLTPYSITWNTLTVTDGNHTLAARARDSAGNITTSSPVIVNVMNHPPDTEFPTVSITSPSAGEVVGIINVAADANDNIGIVGVQFLLNGNNLGTEDVTAPYTVSWNTWDTINGTYTLTAKARDAAGNITISGNIVVTVNNPSDTELPVINITSPAAGNVGGTINVMANATDNAGVIGVQFLLDGNNLGTEDLSTPYSISWNTITTTNGNHVLSAKAHDAAGNIAFAADVNITVSNIAPVISGISVNSVTESSAVISWTTNIPSTSQVNYGTTASYGLSTLVDSTQVTAHSMILNNLVPGTVYHYQVLSGNAGINPSASGDNTFTTAGLATTLGTLNTHTVFAYPAGKIVPWTPNPTDGYSTVVTLAWNYLLNTVPNDPLTGKPAYYSRSYIDPNTQQMVNWDHNPAGLYGMLIESATKYYGYSGNASVMQLAVDVATWHLDHGMTLATDSWPNVPYSEGPYGSLTYNGANTADGPGNLEPDKIGELGYGWLQLYKYNGNIRFRDAAIQCANVLAAKIRTGTQTQSPWPFRVRVTGGSVVEDYCANVIGPISLFDGLIAAGLGNTAAYQTARTTAWNWMMTFPMQNNVWTQYFEDVGVQGSYNSNLNQYNAMMVARYLLQHPEFDANWEAHVRGLITWVENTFGQANFGATAIKEQQVFPYIMGSHTSRYASVNALLYEKTGDLAAKEKAYRSFNWATYMARSTGVVIDGPDVNNQWFSDGYGDYIRHFMTGMAAVPEWTPANQTHLLRSSAVIKNISYGANTVSYTTSEGTSAEVLHMSFNPVTITADGIALPHRSDLSQPGWTLDIATKTLKIYHTNATDIVINPGTGSRIITQALPQQDSFVVVADKTSDVKKSPAVTQKAIGGVKETPLLILPNPSSSRFALKYVAKENGKAMIRITTLEGKTVLNESRAVSKGQNMIYMQSVPSWNKGIYIVSIQQGDIVQQAKWMYQQ